MGWWVIWIVKLLKVIINLKKILDLLEKLSNLAYQPVKSPSNADYMNNIIDLFYTISGQEKDLDGDEAVDDL